MSASGSDSDSSSIDWLASDDDDDNMAESEAELDCSSRPAQTPTPPPPPSPPPSSSPSPTRRCLARSGGGGRYGDGEEEEEEEDDEGWGGSSEDSAQGGGLCVVGAGRPDRSKVGRKAQKRPLSPHGVVTTEHREGRQPGSNTAEKNRLFSAKCMELQCYIHPLSAILNGLRTGRYRERLSSFQESLAMDRIQRIMGVLQNPCMGERYIHIILKIEEMLKTWFPNIRPRDQHPAPQVLEAVPPAKKAKLSAPPGAVLCPFTVNIGMATTGAKTPRVTDLLGPPGAAAYPPPSASAKWLHSVPPLPVGSLTSEQQQHAHPHYHHHHHQARAPPPPPSSSSSSFSRTRKAALALTQDSAVSSSTDRRGTRTDFSSSSSSAPPGARTDFSSTFSSSAPPAPPRPSPAKISAPCLERLLKSTESIIGHKGASPAQPAGGGGAGKVMGSGCS